MSIWYAGFHRIPFTKNTDSLSCRSPSKQVAHEANIQHRIRLRATSSSYYGLRC